MSRPGMRAKIAKLVDELDDESTSASAEEQLEALDTADLFDALEHEKDAERRERLEDFLTEMGESLEDLMARHVPLPQLVARIGSGEHEEWVLEDALRKVGAPAVEALWQAIERETDDDRHTALSCTLEAVSEKDEVAHAIERLSPAELVARTHDPGHKGVTANEALERLGAAAVPPIFDAYADESDEERRTGLRAALASVGEVARPYLLGILRRGGARARLELAAFAALDLAPDAELLAALVVALLAEPSITEGETDYYLERFAPLGKAAVPEMLRLALGSSGETREHTIEVLESMAARVPEAKAALARLGAGR